MDKIEIGTGYVVRVRYNKGNDDLICMQLTQQSEEEFCEYLAEKIRNGYIICNISTEANLCKHPFVFASDKEFIECVNIRLRKLLKK